MDDFFDNWTTQVRKGILELLILTSLQQQERYGYELVKNLVSVPGIDVAEGSIYPLLSRLKKQGFVETKLVESESGPARKYYSLTPNGRKKSQIMRTYFDGLVRGLNILEQGKSE